MIEEIAALAHSLDQEILGAEDGPADVTEPPPVAVAPDAARDILPFEPRRRSRIPAFFAVAALAACAVAGVYLYPRFFPSGGGAGGTAVAVAQGKGGAAGSTAAGTSTATTAAHGEEGPAASTGESEGSEGAEPAGELRRVVREKALLAFQLGLQWEKSKE